MKIPGRKPRGNQPAQDPLEALQAWISELPLANPLEVARALNAKVQELATLETTAAERLELLETCRKPIIDSVAQLLSSYDRQGMDMARREYKRVSLVSELLTVSSQAYNKCFGTIPLRGESSEEMRLLAAYRVLGYLIDRCMLSYRVYRPAPKGLWKELNQWYELSERNNLLSTPLPREFRTPGDTREATIESSYKRLLLVAAANPLRMALTDIKQIFDLTGPWAQSTGINPISDIPAAGEGYVLDLAADVPASAVTLKTDLSSPKARLVDFTGPVSRARNRAMAITQHLRENPDTDLNQRLLRDLLLRAARLWSGSMTRRFERKEINGEVQLAVGVGSAHAHLTRLARFDPKGAERIMERNCGDLDSPDAGPSEFGGINFSLTALPEENDNWGNSTGNEETWDWDEANLIQESSRMTKKDKEIKKDTVEFQSSQHRIRDISSGGMALNWDAGIALNAQVGDIVGTRLVATAGEASAWFLTVVQWIEDMGDGSSRMGLRQFSRTVSACAIRSSDRQTNPFRRALLAPALDPRDPKATLILPTGIFSVGSVCRLLTDRVMARIVLAENRAMNRSFTQFRYTVEAACEHDWDPEMDPDDLELS
ncbi:MAG: hypothetical protein ACPGU7_06225 [Gammaproteobacteria bacterium]